MFRRLSNLAAVLPGRDPVPSISRDTFIVWEPCTRSHAEVVPGYVKYLLDLGYEVSVLLTPKRIEYGLFSSHSTGQKVLLVEHDAKATVDNGSMTPQVITLRKINYKNAATTAVNPHYF